MNSRKNSESKKPDPKQEFEDYADAARSLESHQLVLLLGYNLLMTEKYPKWEGRDERREILRKELARRAIDPDSFTLEDFRLVFKRCHIVEEEQEQQLRGCIHLLTGRGKPHAASHH